MTLEGLFLGLLTLYVLLSVLLGMIKGRKYLKEPPIEQKERDYSFHGQAMALTFDGFALTVLTLFVSLGYGNLDEFLSPMLFLSIAFLAFTVSYVLMQLRIARLFSYLSNIAMNSGLLAIGSGFLVFFWQRLQWYSPIITVYVLLTLFLLVFSFVDFYFYFEILKRQEPCRQIEKRNRKIRGKRSGGASKSQNPKE